MHPTFPKLHILYGLFLSEKKFQNLRAVIELQRAEHLSQDVQINFVIANTTLTVQESFRDKNLKERSSEYSQFFSKQRLVLLYNAKYALFEKQMNESVNLHIDFWNELLDKTPDINKLHNFGNQILNINKKLEDTYKVLNNLDSNNIRCSEIYATYMKEIRNDESSANMIFEK
jgi:GTP1/Obg family GTP-binding protein